MNARYQTLASAHDETLGWIWSRPGLWFGKWLQAGHGVYWITGKPGSGKSTLMKYLADGSQRIATELSHPTFRNSASSQSAQPLTASYFFDFRASDLARSIEGLLRSLLWQLLRQDTKFYKPVMPIYQDIESFKSRFAWTRHDLQLAFQQLLNAAKNINVVIFIDALDEFGGPDIEIAEFLDALSKKAPALTRFCLASRPYPDFAFQFAKCFHLQMQEETYADITKYLHGRFSEMQDIHGSNAWTLMDTIRRKAEGVFLWIKLVCDNLQGGWRRFETFEELLQRIDHLPRDLSTLYQRIFDEMLEDEQEQARRMLEVVAHSVRPLSFLEFYYALGYSYEAIRDSGNSQCCCTVCRNRTRVRLFIDSVERQVSDLRKIPPNVERAMMGRIQAICRGLVDVQSGRPRLLHETVSAYLSQALQHGGTCTNYDSNIVSGDSLLLAACTKFGATLFTDHWPLLEPSESSRNKVCITSVCRGSPGQATLPLSENSVLVVDVTECRLALLDYALKYWLIHAKRTGARTGDGCNWILNQLSGPPFAAWSTLILHYNRWLSDLRPIDLLEMAIYFDLDKYATTELQAPLPTPRSLPHHSHPVHTLLPSMCASSVHRNYGRYLFAVAKSGNYNLAGLLLKYDKASTPARSSVHELNGRLGICRTPNATLTTDEYGKFALHRAIFFGHKSIVELLLNHGVDQALKIGSPNLREFLECGSSIIIENGDCELPPDVKLLRCMARAKGLYDGSFNWLRNNYKASLWGPTVYSTYEWTNSPLELTVRCNYIDEHDAFYTLLGAFQPGVPHASLNSTMTAAAFHGLTEYVQALLSHGVKPNITCYSARFCLLSGTHMCNPLLSAISNGHFEVVGLLLDYGADPNTIINCPSGTQISALETALECWDAVGDGDLFLEIALSYIICKLYWHGARVREESIEALVLKFPEMFQDLDKTLLLDHMDELRGMLEEHRDERWPPKNSPPKSKQPDYLILRDP
jgi:Ankyrin repeat